MEQERRTDDLGWPETLKAARKAKGLTQEELAALVSKRTGSVVVQGQISNWEKGRLPRAATFMALAEVLEVDPKLLVAKASDADSVTLDRFDGERDGIAFDTHVAVVTTAQKLREEKARAEGRVSVLSRIGATEEVAETHKAMARFDLAIKVLADLLAEYGTNPIGGAW